MPDRDVAVVFEGSSGRVTRNGGVLTEFSWAVRARRTGLVLLISLVLAGALIPIPIVHLVGIPLVLGIGILVALRQATSVARLAPMRIACPVCGATNSLGGGLGYRSVTTPLTRACESCRLTLTLRFEESGAIL